MSFPTAAQDKIRRLYHWQRFDAVRFEEQMKNGTVYCSSPRDFNYPWDCRPWLRCLRLTLENEGARLFLYTPFANRDAVLRMICSSFVNERIHENRYVTRSYGHLVGAYGAVAFTGVKDARRASSLPTL